MTVFDGSGHGRDEMPPPFNIGADKPQINMSPEARDELLVAALARLTFGGLYESIRLELFTGDDLLTSDILRIRQVLADKRIPAGDNNAVFTLSKEGQDALLTALANGQTLVIRVTRGTG
jgi:hypothetical protein